MPRLMLCLLAWVFFAFGMTLVLVINALVLWSLGGAIIAALAGVPPLLAVFWIFRKGWPLIIQRSP
jgi:hypothetical protein